jgi:DNA mismatch endonuclease (patch repair protein)
MDRVSSEVRSKIMSLVKTRDTSAETRVRSLVHGLGYRYALHKKGLPGKPDLAFVSRRKIVFVHGCFWHGHGCRCGRLPKSKLSYWRPKIQANKRRDRRNCRALRTAGWRILVVWQCQIKRPQILGKRVVEFLEDGR